MTEYGDASLRAEQARTSAWPDDVTALLAQVNSKLDRVLELLTGPADHQEF